MPADHRSAHPNIAGVPWWGAVLIGVVTSGIGFAFDVGSNGRELTGVFSGLYVLGCLAAVLAVRQSGLFTAAIQPPLILFFMVPGAYYLMHSSDIHGIKDLLINCGYPLIERFPLMFFTSAAVLLLALARWYLGSSSRRRAPASEETHAAGGWLASKLASVLGRDSASDPTGREPRRHSVDRRPRGAPKTAPDRAARAARPVRRSGTPSRSRHARPPNSEIVDPPVDLDRPRPRRPRPRPGEAAPAGQPRRRAPAASERDPRRAAPPGERRAPYARAERGERPPPRRHRDDYRPEDYRPEDYQTRGPQRLPGDGSHHPISRVRYRGANGAEDQPEHRGRRRDPRDAEGDRWKYDI
jgi:hypothetical protein